MHAHPDDETLATGALLATCGAAGVPALVVTCTRGERGEVLALPGTTSQGMRALEGDGPALAAHRTGELAAATRALGVGQVFLDEAGSPGDPHPARYEDSGMVWVAPGVAGPDPSVASGFSFVPLDAAAARLAHVIRATRPDVVATYEAGGGYGHPDHVRAHQVAARAVALAADPTWVPVDGEASPWSTDLWLRVARAGDLRAGRSWLAADPGACALVSAAGLTLPAAQDPLPALARDDDVLAAVAARGDLVEVAVAPVLDAVVTAMRAHATQIQHATALRYRQGGPLGWYALSHGVLAPIEPVETYQVVVRGDRGPGSVGSAR